MSKEFGLCPRYLTFYETVDNVITYEKVNEGTAVSLFIPFNPDVASIYITDLFNGEDRRNYKEINWKKFFTKKDKVC